MEFICRIISSDLSADMEKYRRQFKIKDCIFLLADTWDSLCKDTLVGVPIA